MSIQLDRHAYQKLIDEDILALNKYMPEHSLERKHIVEVLNWSVDRIYGVRRKTVVVVSKGNFDFLDWKKNNLDKYENCNDTMRKVMTHDKVYYCISKPHHLCSIAVDEVVETDRAKENQEYDMIMELIKLNLKCQK